ncbi:hypothetical protein [Halobacillus litoralis]|uniref:hypothetical protein n=1 Tax=Halobacillus litoralis TaxID=45668 RepID=UPI001CFE2C46|nr:hypothetical protein [Halobacillus litoralis]
MILVLFIPILLMTAVVLMFTFNPGKKKRAGLQGKAGLWMLYGYTFILLLSAAAYLLLPMEGVTSASEAEANHGEEQFPYFYDIFHTGNIEELPDEWVVKQWTLNFDRDELVLEAPENDINVVNIFVEKTSDLEGTIEATFYQTPVSVNGHSVEKQYHPSIQVQEGTLEIYPSNIVQLRYRMFQTEFPFEQFTGDKDQRWGQSVTGSDSALYIKVPEHIQVRSSPNTFNMVTP